MLYIFFVDMRFSDVWLYPLKALMGYTTTL